MQNRQPSDASGDRGVTDSGSSGAGVAEPEIRRGPGRPRLEPKGIQVSVDIMVCKSVWNSFILY